MRIGSPFFIIDTPRPKTAPVLSLQPGGQMSIAVHVTGSSNVTALASMPRERCLSHFLDLLRYFGGTPKYRAAWRPQYRLHLTNFPGRRKARASSLRLPRKVEFQHQPNVVFGLIRSFAGVVFVFVVRVQLDMFTYWKQRTSIEIRSAPLVVLFHVIGF